MRVLVWLVGLWVLVGATGGLCGAEKPNVIFILADDLGYGDLGCFGQASLKTPNLDRMAAEGMKLTRFYAGSTVCAPSRCVLMTGLHTGHCRVRGNGPGQLEDEDVTVAEVLKEAGYTTACIGKWGIGNPPPADDPARNGFDHFYGYVNMFHAHNFYPEFLYRNGEKVPLKNVVADKWKEERGATLEREGYGVADEKVEYVPDLLLEDVLGYLDERGADEEGTPFFLYYALNVPHANNEAGRAEEGGDGMEVADWGRFAKREEWPGPEKGFAKMIVDIDRGVGAILEKLEETGMAEDTLVIFSSDNGPHEEGGHVMEFFNSNGEFRGMKRNLTEGGLRVPTIAWWPGTVAAGSESAHIGGFQDFLPTCAELAGVAAPEETDGISLVPTLTGEGEQEAHPYLYWEFLEKGGKRAVLRGDWKAIQLETIRKPGEPIALYNVVEDVGEERDLSLEHPELVEELEALMDEAHVAPEESESGG
ncbi:MAG: arylsulfatase [Verrucomicrobiota bacterium]